MPFALLLDRRQSSTDRGGPLRPWPLALLLHRRRMARAGWDAHRLDAGTEGVASRTSWTHSTGERRPPAGERFPRPNPRESLLRVSDAARPRLPTYQPTGPDCCLVVHGTEVGGHQWSVAQLVTALDDLGLTHHVLATSGDLGRRVEQVRATISAQSPRCVISFSDEAVVLSGVGQAVPLVERFSILRAYRSFHLPSTDLRRAGVVEVVAQTRRVAEVVARQASANFPPLTTIEPYVQVKGRQRSPSRVVVAAGRPDRVKNLSSVVELARRAPEFRFVICTPQGNELADGRPNVEYAATPDRDALLRRMDSAGYYISLTRSDGLANITGDAFALGLPVLLSDADDWTFEQQGAALVWESWSLDPLAAAHPAALDQVAAALRRLDGDAATYESMSRAALDTAARFGFNHYRSRWSAVMERVLG